MLAPLLCGTRGRAASSALLGTPLCVLCRTSFLVVWSKLLKAFAADASKKTTAGFIFPV